MHVFFYLLLRMTSANERRRYKCNDFSQWLRPCSNINSARALVWPGANRPIPQIPECTCPISYNALLRREMCTFLFWMKHRRIGNRCILRFVNYANCLPCWQRSFLQRVRLCHWGLSNKLPGVNILLPCDKPHNFKGRINHNPPVCTDLLQNVALSNISLIHCGSFWWFFLLSVWQFPFEW